MHFENIDICEIMKMSVERNALIIDVRREDAFQKGHIPMAFNIPLDRIRKEQYKLPKNRWLIVYCATGGSSIMAARLLEEQGYKVINAVGGLRNYNKALTLKR